VPFSFPSLFDRPNRGLPKRFPIDRVFTVNTVSEADEASQSPVIEPQIVTERSELAEGDDRTAIRINGMNEPTASTAASDAVQEGLSTARKT
jgi:hypothetical protein